MSAVIALDTTKGSVFVISAATKNLAVKWKQHRAVVVAQVVERWNTVRPSRVKIPWQTWLFWFRPVVYLFSLYDGLSLRRCNRMVHTKGRRGGDICGGERPRRGKILNFPRRGRDGEKKVKIFLAGAGLARKKVKIFLAGACLASPKHTNSRQKYKFLAKIHKNEPIPRHGEEKS